MTPGRSSAKAAPDPVIMDGARIRRALRRIAHEIIENTAGGENLALVGIKTRGVPLARRLADIICDTADCTVPVGVLDITLYRDDFRTREEAPIVGPSDLPFTVDGRTVVLVDDVLYTGRTVRAALDSLMDYGRPQVIRLAVLLDRGQRELPIRADFIGQEIQTEANKEVRVKLKEIDGEDAVHLVNVPA